MFNFDIQYNFSKFYSRRTDISLLLSIMFMRVILWSKSWTIQQFKNKIK